MSAITPTPCYVPWLRGPQLVTCHDLLAVKSALGLVPGQSTGWSGRILQRWILARPFPRGTRGLRFGRHAGPISSRCCPHHETTSEVVTLPLSYPFAPLPPEKSLPAPKKISTLPGGTTTNPRRASFFHVGGNQWYKNRAGVVDIFAELRRAGTGNGGCKNSSSPESRRHPIYWNASVGTALGGAVLFPAAITDAQLQALYSSAARTPLSPRCRKVSAGRCWRRSPAAAPSSPATARR